MYHNKLSLFILCAFFLYGCQDERPASTQTPPQASQISKTAQTSPPSVEKNAAASSDKKQGLETGEDSTGQAKQAQEERIPPSPPVKEDFQGQPQLSLFPRVGDFQPDTDSERHPYWRTFIDHLVKVTGVAENQEDGSRGWVFRSINSIDSLGYFAPLAVEPNTTYNVSFKLTGELPDGASAGIGVLEFSEFLWIGEQYTESTFKESYRGVHEGIRLSGKQEGEKRTFSFKTGSETGMIHLVLFRDGTHDRNALMFDDIEVK